MTKKYVYSFFALGAFFFFACSDDSSSTSVNTTPSEEIIQPTDTTSSDTLKPSKPSEIPEDTVVSCSTPNEFQWVTPGVNYRICEDSTWVLKTLEKTTPGFDACKFNFGAAWQSASENREHYEGVDYIAVWLGDNSFYNSFEKRMIDMCEEVHATPMIYAYVIAEFGKDMGLKDCDMAKDSTHCTHGASLIREFFADSVLSRYKAYAEGIREQYEFYYNKDIDTVEVLWLIEPDFYQYSDMAAKQKFDYDSTVQIGGGIPDSLMGEYFKQIVEVIKKELPASKIAIDISPWILEPKAWYKNFDLNLIDYASTSGGRTSASTERIRTSDTMTWKEIHDILKKPILADAGYDKGGVGTGHAKPWDKVENINMRIADGVIGVMQMDAALDYPLRLDSICVQLDKPSCEK